MRTEDCTRLASSHLSDRLTFNQESSLSPRSSRSSSRSSRSGRSNSSSDRSRSPSVSRRSRRRPRHGSSSSSSSRSRSHPRCYRASDHSRCPSRSYSPYSRRSSRYARRRYLRSISRSSSGKRCYRRSRRSRSHSSNYRRTRGTHFDSFRRRFSPSPVRSYNRDISKSPERSIRLNQKDKNELLNIARENAAKILGVNVVKLPSSVSFHEEQMKKLLESDSKKRVRADPVPLKNPLQNEGEADEDAALSRVSPVRKTISFSITNTVAKPSSSPTVHVTESKVTSRADSVGNRLPYGQWIPVKKVSSKKR